MRHCLAAGSPGIMTETGIWQFRISNRHWLEAEQGLAAIQLADDISEQRLKGF